MLVCSSYRECVVGVAVRNNFECDQSSGGGRELPSGNYSSADWWSQSNGLQVAVKEVGWRVKGMIG